MVTAYDRKHVQCCLFFLQHRQYSLDVNTTAVVTSSARGSNIIWMAGLDLGWAGLVRLAGLAGHVGLAGLADPPKLDQILK